MPMPMPSDRASQSTLPMSHHQDASASDSASASASLPWRLRPTYHLTPPTNWLNDPCGLAHDPSTGLYHLAYQWNPHANNWGNISWGHAVSRDLLSWTTSPRPILEPTCEYDAGGVFTGCLRPAGVFGEDEEDGGCLTAVYTAVSRLPIHYSLPYVRGCESVSLAVSRDGGASWRKVEGGSPVVAGPPGNINVTGWRDPFITSWPALQDSQGQGQGQAQLYGFISGGISQTSPTVFVYTVNPRDLREWKYLGPLVDVGLNHRPGRWSGDLGVNWEVATLVSVGDSRGVSRDFVITGAEGCCIPPPNSSSSRRVPRGQLWVAVKVKFQSQPRFSEQDSSSSRCNTNTPLANYAFSGIFDHGNFYAANSFFDPLAQRHVIYGWITEDDLPDTLRHEQGWSGFISLPRTVELVTLRRVTRARRSELHSITSLEVDTEDDSTGTYTIRTLGIKPDPRVEKLRTTARYAELAETRLDAGAGTGAGTGPVRLPLTTSRWEVDAAFAVGGSCTGVGVVVEHGGEPPLPFPPVPILNHLYSNTR